MYIKKIELIKNVLINLLWKISNLIAQDLLRAIGNIKSNT